MNRARNGQFLRGVRSSPETEFKSGTHWRLRKPFWSKEWLVSEYVEKRRSADEIASDFGLRRTAIFYWLEKHGIKTRSTAEVRSFKHWGSSGQDNPMFGKYGINCPSWRGGMTPFRQKVYGTAEWKAFALSIRRRDKCCRLCGHFGKNEIHHIEPISKKPLLIMWAENVILLCEKCHKKVGRNPSRWKRKLTNLIIGKEVIGDVGRTDSLQFGFPAVGGRVSTMRSDESALLVDLT